MRCNDFLPGRLELRRGRARDYASLSAFHYRASAPATWADVWIVQYTPHPLPIFTPPGCPTRLVAIGVLSWPTALSRARQRHFNLAGQTYRQQLRFANDHLRTISRVIVHPQFRALGLASMLVRCLCDHCPVRYVEAAAMMGRAHPFFERAGMTRIDPVGDDEPVYYLFDRHIAPAPPSVQPASLLPAHAGPANHSAIRHPDTHTLAEESP